MGDRYVVGSVFFFGKIVPNGVPKKKYLERIPKIVPHRKKKILFMP